MIGIAVGDVSGKGAPAAIYAALVSGITRSHAVEEPSAGGMLEAINLSLAERPIDGQYVSMIYAIWNDSERTLAGRQFRTAPPLAPARRKVRRDPGHRSADGAVLQRLLRREQLAQPSPAMYFCSSATASPTPPVPKGNMFGRGRLEKAVLKQR